MTTSAGLRPHFVTLSTLGAPTSDGEGGYTQTPTLLTPAHVWARIVPASVRDLERIAGSAVQSTATHIVTMPYHSGVTTQTVITYGTRSFSVTGVANPDEANRETVCTCVEIVP